MTTRWPKHRERRSGPTRAYIWMVILSLSTWVGCGARHAIATADPTASITCADHDWDFGVVDVPSRLRHTFMLSNPSDRAVKIRKIVPACSPAAAQPVSIIACALDRPTQRVGRYIEPAGRLLCGRCNLYRGAGCRLRDTAIIVFRPPKKRLCACGTRFE